MKALILRLDAPLLSFGTVLVDHHGFTDSFPGLAMVTGLVGNALGWEHGDFEKLNSLQERLDFAARWDVSADAMVDYHTVDLGTDKMREVGWTTRGEVEHRAGGLAARYGIHQRYRHYLVDGLMTIALGLIAKGQPDITEIKEALEKPARPLFIGRKTCLPARPLLDPLNPFVEGESLVEILKKIPVWTRDGQVETEARKMYACWTPGESEQMVKETRMVYDLRDWRNQLPAGNRLRREGMLGVEE